MKRCCLFWFCAGALALLGLCPGWDLLAQGQELIPRTPYPKQVLSPREGFEELLTVKFLDEIQARAVPGGGIISLSGADLSEVTELAGQLGLSFFQALEVSEEKLAELEERAALNTGEAQADLAGILTVRRDEETSESRIEAGNALQNLSQVEYAYLEALGLPPPTHQYLVGSQDYRRGDPGMDMDLAWTRGASRGKGIRLTDCEYNWNLSHEDLAGVPISIQCGVTPIATSPWPINHGTAVLGIIAAQENPYGCTGLAPDAELHVYPEDIQPPACLPPPPCPAPPLCTPLPTCTMPPCIVARATCVTNAIYDSRPGDIVLLEMQETYTCGGITAYVPAEINPNLHAVVKTGIPANQVIVVAAAGNGNQNLDDLCFNFYNLTMGDSGAIIVGAGKPTTTHERHGNSTYGSTYGSRVNVQGWGSGVVTLGDSMSATSVSNHSYFTDFRGTSPAAAMVAAACASLQSFAVDRLCRRLTPTQMRTLLILSGTPQWPADTKHVGPFVNVPAAQQLMLMTLPSDCVFRRGDANNDGDYDISDCITIPRWLFMGGTPPPCLEAADANDDGAIELLDAIYLCEWMFLGKPPPPAPHPLCGPEPAASPFNLGCASSICP